MQILLSLITLIFIAIVTEFWVSPLKDFLFEPLQGPKFDPEKSILDAITSFLVVPKIFVESLNEIKRPIQFIIFSGSVIFICSHLFLKTTFFKNSFHILGLSFLLVGCLLVANSAPWKIFGNQATFRFADSSVTTACLLLSFQMLIFGLIILGKKKTKRSNIKNKTLYLYLSVNLFLLTTPFVFAFGSGNGPYRLAAMASGIFLLSSLSSALLISLAAKTKYSLFGILLFSLFLVTIYIKDSRELPYRNSSIANQIQSIEVGKHRSKLKIDSFLANELEKLKDGACRNGWAFDTPLLGVVWYWASTVPYVLGAKVPDCLMLTLFTYPNSVCVADYMINNRLEKFDSKNAWILTNRKSSLDQQKSDEVRRVLDKLTNVTGRVFPRDYIIAASNQSLELWKPKDPSKKPLTYFNSSTLVKK